MDNLTDNELDFHIRNLDNKIMDKGFDKLFSSDCNINILKYATPVMRLWNNFKHFKD